MNNRIIDDYLDRVTRDMGRKQRQDVRGELKSHILDSADAIAAERNVAVDDSIVRDVLAKMGPPEKLAAAYPSSMRDSILFDRVIIAGAAIVAILVILLIMGGVLGACLFISYMPFHAGNVSQPIVDNINMVEHRTDKTSHAGAGNVSLDVSTIGGRIEIVESMSDNIEVIYDVRASKGHLNDIVTGTDYSQDGDTLKVKAEAKYAGQQLLNLGTRGADVLVKVPRNSQYRLNLKTAGGDLSVTALNGSSMVLDTMGGNIEVDGGRYNTLTATTAGGMIDAKYTADNATFTTLGGNIVLDAGQTAGTISATTMGGNIEIRLPKNTLFSADASTFGGNIDHNGIAMTLSQSNGMHLIGHTEAGEGSLSLKASTMGGNIEIIEN